VTSWIELPFFGAGGREDRATAAHPVSPDPFFTVALAAFLW